MKIPGKWIDCPICLRRRYTLYKDKCGICYQRLAYHNNEKVRQRVKAWNKKWRQKNPEKAKAIRHRHYLKTGK